MSLEAHMAERAILSILAKNPDKFYTLNEIMSEADFINTGNSLIFGIVKDIILSGSTKHIDAHLILSEAERKGVDGFLEHTLNGELIDALLKMKVSEENLGRYVADVKQASIKRALILKCEDLKDKIENYSGPSIDLRNMVESDVLDSLRHIDNGGDDLICLSDGFEDAINHYAERDGKIGIDVMLPKWQQDIGHIRNGAITGLFARTKVGKSQFSMWSAYQTAIVNKLPTLYLDTELQPRQQQMRLCGIVSGIPYDVIESGKWKSDRLMISRIKEAFTIVKNAPLFYKNIAGRSVHNVIPIIRKFVYKYMGGPIIGDQPKGLVIYDYIKLMDSQDLGKTIQEYQLIGLLLSGLHDCAAHLNIPMVALGQLNKQEEVGIDRIVHNVDSVTILRPKRPEEIEEHGLARGTHALEVKYSRNGPGHEFGDWINVHFNKSCGQFKEDKRNNEITTILKNVKEQLELEDTKHFGDVKEDF